MCIAKTHLCIMLCPATRAMWSSWRLAAKPCRSRALQSDLMEQGACTGADDTCSCKACGWGTCGWLRHCCGKSNIRVWCSPWRICRLHYHIKHFGGWRCRDNQRSPRGKCPRLSWGLWWGCRQSSPYKEAEDKLWSYPKVSIGVGV